MAEYVFPVTQLLPLTTYTSSGSGVGSTVSPSQPARAAFFELLVQQASTSGATLDVYIQSSILDGSSSGRTWDDFVHFAQVTAAGVQTAQWVRGVIPSSSTRTPQSGALTASTVRNGPIGGDLQAKYVIVGSSSMTPFKFGLFAQFAV